MSSKKQNTPIAPTVQEVPLSDVTITWEKPCSEFEGEDRKVTITGAQLGPVLKWMSHAKHAALDDSDLLLDPRLNLSGVADILLALSETNFQMIPIDPHPIFRLLSRVTEDAKAMIIVAEDDAIPKVTITIGRPVSAEAEKKAAA
jgi:hypothetical protein